jgi:hypothetical protein
MRLSGWVAELVDTPYPLALTNSVQLRLSLPCYGDQNEKTKYLETGTIKKR